MATGGDLELFSFQSFATLQGGAAAAIAVASVLGHLFPTLTPRRLSLIGFIVAELTSYVGASLTTGGWPKWVVAGLNGFVIFSAALGLNQALFAATAGAGVPGPMQGAGERTSRPRARLFRSWL